MADQQTHQDSGKMTKSRLIEKVAEQSGVTKKQANAVLDALDQVVGEQLGRHGEASIPGMVKLNVQIKPATPEREGINPFTKQPTVFKAKPERKVVKARVLKGLKDSVGNYSGGAQQGASAPSQGQSAGQQQTASQQSNM